jgi:hypothetical protein
MESSNVTIFRYDRYVPHTLPSLPFRGSEPRNTPIRFHDCDEGKDHACYDEPKMNEFFTS